MSSTTELGENEERHNRLLNEYTKLKAQNSLLKKAVLSEQEKNVSLQNQLNAKDQELRKNAQDIDQLSFHNNNLTKRISFLQSELSQKQETSWIYGNKKELKKKSDALSAVEQDLKSKIQENETLHEQLEENTFRFTQTIITLEKNLKSLQEKFDSMKATTTTDISNRESQIQSLIEKNSYLERSLQDTKLDLSSMIEKCKSLEKENQTTVQNMITEIETLKKRERKKNLMDDAHNSLHFLNNIPIQDKSLFEDVSKVSEKMSQTWRQVSGSLSSYHDLYRSRVTILMGMSEGNVSEVNAKLHHVLCEFDSYLKSMENTIQLIDLDLKTPPHQRVQNQPKDKIFNQFVDSFEKILNFFENVTPLQQMSLQEETLTDNSPSSRSRNEMIVESLGLFLQSLIALKDQMKVNSKDNLNELNSKIDHVYSTLRVLSTQFSSKLSNENRQPNILPDLKNVNDRLIVSLGAVVSSIGLVKPAISRFNQMSLCSPRYLLRGNEVTEHPNEFIAFYENRYSSKTRDFMKKTILNKEPESISYEESLHFRSLVLTSTQSQKELNSKINDLNSRNLQLEKEKQSLLLESALSKATIEQEQRKAQMLSEEMDVLREKFHQHQQVFQKLQLRKKTISDASTCTSDFEESKADSNNSGDNQKSNLDDDKINGDSQNLEASKIKEENEMEQLKELQSSLKDFLTQSPSGVSVSSEQLARENLIKKHFESKINQLNSQVQALDSQNLSWQEKIWKYLKEIEAKKKNEEKLLLELEKAKKQVHEISDKLTTTEKSYSAQLNLMTEHICTLNSKVSSQEEEIEKLLRSANRRQK